LNNRNRARERAVPVGGCEGKRSVDIRKRWRASWRPQKVGSMGGLLGGENGEHLGDPKKIVATRVIKFKEGREKK